MTNKKAQQVQNHLEKIAHLTHAGHQLDRTPLIVGVINLSPESFYKGSIANTANILEEKISEMHKFGVACLDVGAMSTRPISIYGGSSITENQEIDRIHEYLPKIIEICNSYSLAIALDTQSAEAAQKGIDLGVSVINDISGLKSDKSMASVVAASGVDLVLMATDTKPGDVCGVKNTILALKSSLQIAEMHDITRSKIALDPGFGGWQGRSASCDIELIKHFEDLHTFELPLYIGVSRKSTINTLNGGEEAIDRLPGSLILTNYLVDQGASIIRTHDVKETVLSLRVKSELESITQ